MRLLFLPGKMRGGQRETVFNVKASNTGISWAF